MESFDDYRELRAGSSRQLRCRSGLGLLDFNDITGHQSSQTCASSSPFTCLGTFETFRLVLSCTGMILSEDTEFAPTSSLPMKPFTCNRARMTLPGIS